MTATKPTMPNALPPQAPVAAAAASPSKGPSAQDHWMGGMLAGLGEGLLFCAPDQAVLRARLRRDPHASVCRELSQLVKEGPRSMFRGLAPDLFGTAARRASLPTLLHTGKGIFSDVLQAPPQSLGVSLAAGAVAGAVDPLLTNPPGRLRTLIQAPANNALRLNTRSALRLVEQQEGLRGLFKGLPTNMVRGASYCMVIAGSIHTLDRFVPPAASPGLQKALAFLPGTSHASVNEWRKVLVNVGAAVTAVVAVSPLDVLLARRQEAVGKVSQSTIKVLTTILRQEGLGVLFTGTAFKTAMLAPRQGITLYLAERITAQLTANKSA